LKKSTLYAGFVFLLMLAMVVTGCSQTTETSTTKPEENTATDPKKEEAKKEPVTIIITNGKGEISKQWEQAAKDFSAANPEVTIEAYSNVVGDSLSAYEKLSTSGKVVTLAMFEPGSLLSKNNGVGIDLSGEKWAGETADIAKDATGTAVGFPFAIEGYGIVYNKAVVEKAVGGAFDPYSINTRDKLIELFDKVKASGVEFPVAYQTEPWSVGNHYGSLFLNQGGDPGATLASLNNGELKLKDNATWNGLLDTMDVLASEKYNKFGKRPLGKLYDEAHRLVGSGESAFLFNGNWAYDSLKALPESDFGFIPVPVDNDASNVMNTKLSAGPAQVLVVNKAATPAQQDAAKRFLNWIVYEAAGQDFLVTKSQVVPAFKNIALSVTNPLGKAVGAAVKEGKTMPFSTNYINAGDYMEKIGPEVQKYIDKKVTRDQLAKTYEDYHATLKK
jgi:raffinose/stachyose/melibiose transport system substrate-binding protein